MNKAITDGITLMPLPFVDGLNHWSSEDGHPGSATYQGAANAALVASDPDFGPCLELEKTQSLQKLRYMGEIPVIPGCYLRVSVRFKVLNGLFPSLRIAAWAGSATGTHVPGLVETGPEFLPSAYGRVYQISAIIGSGQRQGVDMVWGNQPVYGHFGLDMLGDTGAIVRIENIRIEDVTHVFHRKMMGWVDVRDYGAVGDGLTDDATAFEMADAAAQGRTLVVPQGNYYLSRTVTLSSRCQFEGKLVMPPAARLQLTRSYNYATYVDAFGNETEALKRALAALFNFSDHESLDLGGRRIQLDGPIDVHAAVANRTGLALRRVIRNGELSANTSANWADDVTVASAAWTSADSRTLSSVTNIGEIKVGALVTGAGVGREIYVTAVDTGAQSLTLSQPLINPAASQTYTFRRFKYLLDFSGFNDISRFQIADLEFRCVGNCSGVILARTGNAVHIRNCWFIGPKDRAITSYNTGCNGMSITNNEFLTNEYATPAQDRVSIAITTNSNDVKIRNNRAVRYRHFAVIAGGGHIISGNHFWQGDEGSPGQRTAGIVFTNRNPRTVLVGNYIDNCFVELSNEHAVFANATSGSMPFGALSLSGNIFTVGGVNPWFTYLRLTPRGANHTIDGISMVGNTFKTIGGSIIDRPETIDTSHGSIDLSKTLNVVFSGNTYTDVTIRVESPAFVEIEQVSAATTWSHAQAGRMPFGGRVRSASGLTALGPITSSTNVQQFDMPHVNVGLGGSGDQVQLVWPAARKGRVGLRLHCDLPG